MRPAAAPPARHHGGPAEAGMSSARLSHGMANAVLQILGGCGSAKAPIGHFNNY
jgi:hypothetical protein